MTPGPAKQFDRDAVLERAMTVFWEHGYEATGMAQLLEAMSIGRQSLYDTFGDKRSLFLETLAHYFRTRIAPGLLMLKAEGSPLGNLRGMFQAMGRQMAQQDFSGCLIGNCTAEVARDDPEIAAKMSEYFNHVEDAFTEVLTRAQQAGEISADADPRALARIFMYTAQGITLISKATKSSDLAASVIDTAFELMQPTA